MLVSICLTGCFSGIWTGASMVYDRHNMYRKISNYQLSAAVNNALFADKKLRESGCSLDVAVFNNDILLVGHVPTNQDMEEIQRRLAPIKDYRHFYNKITINPNPLNNSQDAWITTKIRSQIFADDSIDPKAFKVMTADGIVYLMGDVMPDQAEKVVTIARNQSGVVQVVKLMQYFTYQGPKANGTIAN